MAAKTTNSAAAICENVRLSHRAQHLLKPGESAGDFLRALVEAACYKDAVTFMTHAVTPRQAVWWACLCVRHTLGKTSPSDEKQGVLAAVRCVVAPGEDHHREVLEVASRLSGKSALGCLTRAAGHLGGKPHPELAVRLASTAINLAVAAAGPSRRDFLHRQYIFIGLDVARAALPWR